MAIRDDFTAGEVLAAADLNDTFASKVPFSYGTATPTTTVDGFVWYDENSTPPLVKFWDGSAFQTFSAGPANFSDAATGTYTDSGIDYKYLTYTGSGSLTVTKAGFADVLVVGGGGASGGRGGGGGGGFVQILEHYLEVATYTITVGAGSTSAFAMGGVSSIDTIIAPGGGYGAGGGLAATNGGSGGGGKFDGPVTFGFGIPGFGNDGDDGTGAVNGGGGGGAGGAATTAVAGVGAASSLTGTSVTYARGGGGGAQVSGGANGAANTGNGADASNDGAFKNGGSGIVIIRVRTN